MTAYNYRSGFSERRDSITTFIDDVLELKDKWVHTAGNMVVIPLMFSEAVASLEYVRQQSYNSMFTIGFVGPFSSGKSMLISAILGQIHAELDDEDGGWTWDSDLLPTDTRPTTSHPVEIRHADSLSFMVRYEGDQYYTPLAPTKENITNHVSETFRFGHRKSIVDAILLTPDVPFPGQLLDLPGTQSTRQEDEAVILNGLARADCFVFVLSAARTIDSMASSQLSDLHSLYITDGKPVFFALTQIDTTMNRATDGQYAWQHSQIENNNQLASFIDVRTNQPDYGFIGKGFVPVASIASAKAQYLEQNGLSDKRVDAEMRLARPGLIIEQLIDFFYREVAPARLERYLSDASVLRDSIVREMKAMGETLNAPLRDLERRETEARRQQKALQDSRQMTEMSAAHILDQLLETAFSNAQDSLATELRLHVEPIIMRTKHVDEAVVNEIQKVADSVVARWSNDSEDSPLRKWRDGESSCMKSLLVLLYELLEASDIEWEEDQTSPLDLVTLTDPVRHRLRPSGETAVFEVPKAVEGVITFGGAALGAGGAVAGAIGIAGMAFLPAGAILSVAAIIMGIRSHRKRATQIAEQREGLDNYVDVIVDLRVKALKSACVKRKGALLLAFQDAINIERQRLSDDIVNTRTRLRSERSTVELVDQLESLRRQIGAASAKP